MPGKRKNQSDGGCIFLSENAAEHIRKQLSNRGSGLGIRVGVRTTGCSGLSYVLEFVDERNEKDEVFESEGVNIFIDPESFPFLQGITMDYTKEGLNEGFCFANPNSKGECGCGESFHT